jgi:hypothetical protein
MRQRRSIDHRAGKNIYGSPFPVLGRNANTENHMRLFKLGLAALVLFGVGIAGAYIVAQKAETAAG